MWERVLTAHVRAYGCVYKAIHVATEQEVAIKTVLFGAEEGEGVAEIKKEIDILKRVRACAAQRWHALTE